MAGNNNRPGRSKGGAKAGPATAKASTGAMAAAKRLERADGLAGRAKQRLDAVSNERSLSAWKIKPEGPNAATRWMKAARSVTNGVDVRAGNFLRGTTMPRPRAGREAGYRPPMSRLR